LQSVPPNWDETTVSPSTSGLGAIVARILSVPAFAARHGQASSWQADPAWMRYLVPAVVGKVSDEVRSVALTSSLQATAGPNGQLA
jgi:hypothetical protein